jgi:hypothetical protein
MHLATRDLKLTSNVLTQTVYGPIRIEFNDAGVVETLSGIPSAFSNATHKVGPPDFLGTPLTDSWTHGGSNGPVEMSLITTVRTAARSTESPIITLAEAQIRLEAKYSRPMPIVDLFTGGTNSVLDESIFLTTQWGTNSKSIEVTRTSAAETGAAITTTFFWPEPPAGPSAGYTAPVIGWKETRIEGLTTEPIVLRGYYSQTYRPHHHNFSEDFLFEPALEPGFPTTLLAELEAKNIRQIYFHWGGDNFASKIWVAGHDGNFRPLSSKPTTPKIQATANFE